MTLGSPYINVTVAMAGVAVGLRFHAWRSLERDKLSCVPYKVSVICSQAFAKLNNVFLKLWPTIVHLCCLCILGQTLFACKVPGQ